MLNLHVRSGRQNTPAGDETCCWDNSASELGLSTPAAPAASAPAEPAAADKTSDTPTPDVTDRAAADEDVHDDPADRSQDDDADADPLDALTSDDEDDGDQRTDNKAPVDPKMQRLKQRTRKLERSLKKALPTITALKESGLDVRTLLHSHQQLSNLQALLDRNPRVRALLEGDPDPGDTRTDDRRDGGRRAAAEPETVDYPFDVNDDVGRFISDFHKSSTRTQGDIVSRLERIESAMNQRVGRIEGALTEQQQNSVKGKWKSAVDKAQDRVPVPFRRMFNDAMFSAMNDAMAGRHRMSPDDVINHYLKEVKAQNATDQRRADAGRQRTAQNNQQLPRRPVGGTPASPRSAPRPRLEDFNRDIQRRFGAA